MRMRTMVALLVVFALTACADGESAKDSTEAGQSASRSSALILGDFYYSQRLPLPEAAALELTLISLTDSGADVVVGHRLEGLSALPPAFEFVYWPADILEGVDYRLAARITVAEQLLFEGRSLSDPFVSDQSILITMQAQVGADDSQAQHQSLLAQPWQLSELSGAPLLWSAAESIPELHFFADGELVGSDGCNRYRAQFQLMADQGLAITQGISTMMACEPSMAIADAFRQALARVDGWRIRDGYLQLLAGERVLLQLTAAESR